MPKRKGADVSEDDNFSADNSDQHESDAVSSQEEAPLKLKKEKVPFRSRCYGSPWHLTSKLQAPAKKKAKPVPDASASSSKKQSSAVGIPLYS